MSYDKRLIVDLDDTISRTINRDWENAEPILPIIEKINRLYDEGWEIFIVTARGQLSCKGNYKKADKKYRTIIENWLKINNVKYHKLSFMKELGSYYIDDKALLPEEFINLDIRVLKAGWSGAMVEKRGNKVYKTHPNALNEALWYKTAAHFCNTPKVYSVIGKTLCLEYIEHDEKNHVIKIDNINSIIKKFMFIPNNVSFVKYIERIKKRHLDVLGINGFNSIIYHLEKYYDTYNSNKSFCHGDLSLENILIDYNKKHYLIDPIYEPDQYSSWMLDVSKLIHSFRKHNDIAMVEFLYNYYGNFKCELYILEITQWIRVIKYLRKFNQSLANEYIEKIKRMIKEVPEC